jgi:site-specific DNA recombinase
MIAAVYARKSTDQTGVADEQKSVARQVDHAREYAARKGWTVNEELIFVDDGISGAEFANRPGFLRLMNALKPRTRFQVLVMSEESRLGREAIETAYALKQLVTAGVRVFFYLEDRERTLDSPTDKIMMSLTAFADELEREKARQRTRDAMVRKAKAGHVTGGACFGYRNVEITAADGRRSHVERVIEPGEADVIRRIFQMSAAGYGLKAIAKQLNDEGVTSPRAQRGRSQSWAPTSVREVLHRQLYRGEIVWAQTAKRDKWGQKNRTARAETDWIRRPAPALRIVSDEVWNAAHRRLDAVRSVYMKATNGQPFGRPPLGDPSKYLLTNLALCGCCGGTMKVRSRSHGNGRKFFYGCSGYHDRGRAVCTNGADVPMEDANGVALEALLDDVLDEALLRDTVDATMNLLQGDGVESRAQAVELEIARIDRERARIVSAIATGGEMAGLVEALQERERRLLALQADRAAVAANRRLDTREIAQLRVQLVELAGTWRHVLADDPAHARPIVSALLKGRVMYTPIGEKRWQMSGEGTYAGLFTKDVLPFGMASPTGFEPEGIPFVRIFRAA